jgi:hypothetical protein
LNMAATIRNSCACIPTAHLVIYEQSRSSRLGERQPLSLGNNQPGFCPHTPLQRSQRSPRTDPPATKEHPARWAEALPDWCDSDSLACCLVGMFRPLPLVSSSGWRVSSQPLGCPCRRKKVVLASFACCRAGIVVGSGGEERGVEIHGLEGATSERKKEHRVKGGNTGSHAGRKEDWPACGVGACASQTVVAETSTRTRQRKIYYTNPTSVRLLSGGLTGCMSG